MLNWENKDELPQFSYMVITYNQSYKPLLLCAEIIVAICHNSMLLFMQKEK